MNNTSKEKVWIHSIGIKVEDYREAGEALYQEFCRLTSAEGYRDDLLLNTVRQVWRESGPDPVVESCFYQRTFDWVEASFLFPDNSYLIDGQSWFGGYVHTFKINRRNQVEVHPGTLLYLPPGLRVVIDWLEPRVLDRSSTREQFLETSTEPASRAKAQASHYLEKLNQSQKEEIDDFLAALSSCSIPKSAKEGIQGQVPEYEMSLTRYQCVEYCARYARLWEYEVAYKYWETAGRILTGWQNN